MAALFSKGNNYCLLLFIFFLTPNSFAQETKKTELDSIYSLQADFYRAKKYKNIIELSHYAQSIKLENSQDSIMMARVTSYIGYANNSLNRFYESIDGFNEALKYIPKEKNEAYAKSKYYILFGLMTRYYSLKRYKKALSIIEDLEQILYEGYYQSDHSNIQLLNRKFKIYSILGYFDKAKEIAENIKRVITSSKTLKGDKLKSAWINYYNTKLLAHYYEALHIKKKQRDYDFVLKQITPQIKANIKKLDSIYENTETLKNPKSQRQIWNLSKYVGTLYYTSDYYKQIDDFETALKYIEKVISLSKKANEPIRNVTEFLRFKANIYRNLGDNTKALALVDSIERNFDSEKFNLNDIHVFKGDLYAREKQLDSTLFYYKKTVDFMHNSNEILNSDFSNFSSRYQFPSDAKQLDHISYMLMKNFNDNATAIEFSKNLNHIAYNEFIEGHENLDLSLGNKQLFYDILSKKIYLNKDNFKKKNEFINNLENISNRIAWNKFSQSRDIIKLPIIDSIEEIEYEIRKQLVRAKNEKRLEQKDSLSIKLKLHQNRVAQNYSTISSHTQDNFDIINFQKSLHKDQVVLKYLFFLDQFAVIQITKNNITWDLKPWEAQEKKLVKDHLYKLKNPQISLDFKTELTHLLIPESSLKFNSIVIVPDTPIYNLPFETLWYKDDYLIEEKTIHYSSHLRFLFFEDHKVEDNPHATIFAPDYPQGETTLVTRSAPVFLEGAQKEAKALEKFFPSNLYIAEKATKENFVDYKSDGNILHLAMHASLDEYEPVLSHFNFSNNEKLYLEELYALKIPAELAVLSACNTGVGKVEEASGLATLQRAFNYAGTKATIASLWEVPDESTSQIMISFYKNLKKGETKSKALQNAKIEYLENTKISKLKHPYYWAGFVLYGDNSAITEESNLIYLVIGIVLILSILIVLFLKKRKQT